MKKLLLFVLIATISSYSLQAQITVKGNVVDTTSFMNLQYTTITALKAGDSILQGFTRADENGNFSLQLKNAGKYIFMFSHPVFAEYITTKDISSNGYNFGEVNMINKTYLLKEVIISEKRAITIKGDTTEYNADSFKVREFANVDELLKKLPGIEVDDKGNITAHGEKVQKMLVDGDEFFSDDPAVLAKMLRASAVDKVQVYDKKSDEAEFTGVDDGTRIKTINLKLKDNAKAGYFGKLELGGGLPDYWENQAMINSFKDKRKFSVYGVMSNTNNVGLGWSDASKYGGASVSFGSRGGDDDDDGIVFSSRSSDDGFNSFDGSFGGQGLPKTWNGGIHFGDKYGKTNNIDFTADYRIYKNELSTISNQRTQYLSTDTQYYNNSSSDRFNSSLRNRVSNYTKFEFDSTSDLLMRVSGFYDQSQSITKSTSSFNDINNDSVSSSNTFRENDGNTVGGNIELTYRKKFNKAGRSFTARFLGNLAEENNKGDFNSINKLFTTGTEINYNQYKTGKNNDASANVRVTYTEPLVPEKVFLVTNYYTNYTNNFSENLTYDNDASGAQIINDSLSNSYRFKVLTNSIGANLRFNYEKYKFSFGGNVAYANFNQENILGLRSDTTYGYLNFFPRASLRLGKSRMNRFEIRYNGSTSQPSINQIQPIINNTDPLNLMVGNPDLKQQFRHNFNVNFGKFQVLQERYLYGGLGATLTDNAISLSQNISNDGVRTYQYVNLDGNYSTYLYSGYSFPIKPLKIKTRVGLNGNYNRNRTILNGDLINSNNFSISPNLSLDYDRDSTMYVSYSFNPSWNKSTTTNSTIENNYWSTTQSLNGYYRFKHNIEIGTDINWLIREKIDEFDFNNKVFIWNAYVSKSFLKDRSLVVKVSGNDILNQNIGFSRYAYNNQITENFYNNIRRYFMLHLTWNFTHSNAMGEKGSDIEEVKEADIDPENYSEPKEDAPKKDTPKVKTLKIQNTKD